MNTFYNDRFSINRNNSTITGFFTMNSGRIIYRDKIDTVMGVKHPGIILGVSSNGKELVIHNHYKIGHAEIVTLDEFTAGSNYFFDCRKVFYNTRQIVERAIESWKERRPYTWLTNNCQQYVNRVVSNVNFSEAVDNGSNRAVLIGGAISIAGMITGNGTVIKAGFSIAGLGIVGKLLNT